MNQGAMFLTMTPLDMVFFGVICWTSGVGCAVVGRKVWALLWRK
jgi:hypothetical protein